MRITGKPRKYYGMDTETPLGNLKVFATDKEVIGVTNFLDIVSFLTQKKYRGSILYSFNLKFDGESTLKTTNNLEFLTNLYHNGAKRDGVWYNDNIKLRWIGSKFLQICKNKNCVRIYDIAQFYSGWSLDKVARKYLGSYKNPIDGHRLGSEPGYYEDNIEDVKEYCRKDAELALRAAQLMRSTIEETSMHKGKLSFKNPISQAKVSEIYIKENYIYPRVSNKLRKLHFAAYLAYHGGIFSTLKRGLFKQPLYYYDINSAYPYEMQKLPNWSNGRFIKVNDPEEVHTRYGWFNCTFNCQWIPLPDFSVPYEVVFKYKDLTEQVKLNNKRVIYPVGERTQWITKIEYEWLLKNNFPVKFLIGFVWEQLRDEYEAPFSWCEDVYNRRRDIKDKDPDDIRQYGLKIVMNGAYGKTAQAKKGFGILTNFFYSSYITAGTRLYIADVVILNPEVIVDIATDSVISLQPLSIHVSKALGDWNFKKYDKGLFIGSGIRQVWQGDKSKTAARGLTDKTDWDMLKEITTGYNEEEGKPNIDCDYLFFTKERPIHLGEIIYHHKILSLKDLIVFTKVSKKLNVNTDEKRRWARRYKSFKDLLESEPMNSEPLHINDINENH